MGSILWTQETDYSKHVFSTSNYNEALLQLFYGATWDGDLIDKSLRTDLVSDGYAMQINGWNAITAMGILYLMEQDLIRPQT